jgi:hypothetical protein
MHNNIEMHKIDKEVGSNFINLGQITTQSKWKKIGDLRGMFNLINLGPTTVDLKWKKIGFDLFWLNHIKSHQSHFGMVCTSPMACIQSSTSSNEEKS